MFVNKTRQQKKLKSVCHPTRRLVVLVVSYSFLILKLLSHIINQWLQESSKQFFKQDEQETVRLNAILNRRSVNCEVY